MLGLEHSIRPLTHERNLGHVKWLRQLWKQFADCSLCKGALHASQLVRQVHVKPKGLICLTRPPVSSSGTAHGTRRGVRANDASEDGDHVRARPGVPPIRTVSLAGE